MANKWEPLVEIDENKKCSFNCGDVARYVGPNGNYCCSSHHTRCPATRSKMKNSIRNSTKTKRTPKHFDLEIKRKMGRHRLGKIYSDKKHDVATLIRSKKKQFKCELCNQSEFLDFQPIPLKVYFKDGNSKNIDKKNKFKIYASPFTPIDLDRHNHVSTTDVRLLRRLVRDNARRGYDAEATLSQWKKMRKSEEKFVFPYQTEADAVVNTALIYEVNALKTYAEPLLYSIETTSDNYKEAIRLINFLKCFFCIADDNIPDTSVLREFIGKSYFE